MQAETNAKNAGYLTRKFPWQILKKTTVWKVLWTAEMGIPFFSKISAQIALSMTKIPLSPRLCITFA